MAFDSDKDILFAACGDCKTRSFDLETGKVTLKLDGHEDYVHDVAIRYFNYVFCLKLFIFNTNMIYIIVVLVGKLLKKIIEVNFFDCQK